jgi:hypothetical protein
MCHFVSVELGGRNITEGISKWVAEENIWTQGEEVTGGNLHDEFHNLYNHLILLKSDYQRGRVGQGK